MNETSIAVGDGGVLSALVGGDPSGPALLLLHGLGFSSDAWRRQFEDPKLKGMRLVALDLRGHGRSSFSGADRFDEPMWAADVSHVIDAFGLREVVVVAWSYGGLVLGSYVSAHPTATIAGVVLVAAATRAGVGGALADFGPTAVPDGFVSDDPALSAVADTMFVEGCRGEPSTDVGDLDAFIDVVGGTRREAIRRMLSASFDFEDMWSSTDLPMLLVHGSHDRVNLPVISERLARWRPDARWSVYEGSGHMPFWFHSERFGVELAAFASALR